MDKRVGTLYLLHILNDGFRSAVIAILPFVAYDLSLSLTQVGFLGSSQLIIGTVLALPAGYLAAKFGGFSVLIVSLLVYSLGFFGISSAPHFSLLLLAYFATAFGFGCFHPVSFALVTRISETGKGGKTMGNFMSVGEIGRLIIPTLALLLIPFIGWRMMLSIAAVIGLGLFLFCQFYLHDKTKVKVSDIVPIGSKRDWLKETVIVLKQKQFKRVLLSAIGDTLASSNIFTFLPFLLLSRGVNATQLVLFTTAFFAGSLSGKSLLGRAVDRFGNRSVFIASEVAMAVILVLLVLTNQFVLLVLFSYLIGIFTKGTSPVIQTLISKVTHEAHYEKAYGASETFIQIAGAITIFISGIVADRVGIKGVFLMSAALALFATIPLIGFKLTVTESPEVEIVGP